MSIVLIKVLGSFQDSGFKLFEIAKIYSSDGQRIDLLILLVDDMLLI